MNAAFWKGRRVLVTGHTGFKGSWLSLWLQSLGAEVTGYALAPPTTPSLFEAAEVGRGMKSIQGDVLDRQLLARSLNEAQPEVVFHLAAQSLVRESYRAPVETFGVNVMGTAHLLEAARQTPAVAAVVVVTSDKCYENREWVWGYRENEPLGGHDPYSASKGCAELVAAAYRRSFFQPSARPVGLATARAGNVIGGGDWAADRIVPDAVRAFAQGQVLQVRNPAAVRPWQHVLEPLSGYLLLAELLHLDPARWSGAWNFGPEEASAVPVARLVDELCAQWPGAAWHSVESSDAPHEAHYLKLDCSKARQELGWQPRLSLVESISMTSAWYQRASACFDAHRQLCHMRDFTLSQVEAYYSTAAAGTRRQPPFDPATEMRPPAKTR